MLKKILVISLVVTSLLSCTKEEDFPTKVPILLTKEVTDITKSTANCTGVMISDGGGKILERGVCLNEVGSPEVENDLCFTTNSTNSEFSVNSIQNLKAATTYYIRAYAKNKLGTGYGNETTFTTKPDYRSFYKGGYVFYLDETGEHGLVAATENQSEGISWCEGENIQLYTTLDGIGNGSSNTKKIIETYGSGNYAAKICDDLELNGYNDWFLPSQKELIEMYSQLFKHGDVSFTEGAYWSSSESSKDYADFYVIHETLPGASGASKQKEYKVRAAREF